MERQKLLEMAELLCERCRYFNYCYLVAYGDYCDLVLKEAERTATQKGARRD